MEKSGLRYSFESTNMDDPGRKYQVRINGEFIMYTGKHSSEQVDKILAGYGYASRREVLDYVVEERSRKY